MIRARLNTGDKPVVSVNIDGKDVTVHLNSVLRAVSLLPTVKYLIKESRRSSDQQGEEDRSAAEREDGVAGVLDLLEDAGYSISLKKGPFKLSLR